MRIQSTGGTSYVVNRNATANLEFLNVSAAGNITFFTNSTERMRVDNVGNVGIGTTSIQHKLKINNTTDINLGVSAGTVDATAIGIHAINDANTANIPLELRASKITFSALSGGPTNTMNLNGLGLGLAPIFQLDLSTDSARKLTTTTWATGSDVRLKENIIDADLDICYNTLKNIPLKRFSYKDTIPSYKNIEDKNMLGWIAQDVQEYFPNAVKQNQQLIQEEIKDESGNVVQTEIVLNDCLTLQSDQLTKIMYGTIQKLIQRLETLESEFQSYKTTHP
jgi:hypothetical protein